MWPFNVFNKNPQNKENLVDQSKLDNIQEQKLGQLYPPFATIVRQFLIEAKKQNYNVELFEGLRSYERQVELYNLGRDSQGNIVDKTKVVTKKLPGRSIHTFGCAVDIVFKDEKGNWDWDDNKYPWKNLSALGHYKFGLDAGGLWTSFVDFPHYQLTYGLSDDELYQLYTVGGLQKVWQELDKKR